MDLSEIVNGLFSDSPSLPRFEFKLSNGIVTADSYCKFCEELVAHREWPLAYILGGDDPDDGVAEEIDEDAVADEAVFNEHMAKAHSIVRMALSADGILERVHEGAEDGGTEASTSGEQEGPERAVGGGEQR